MIDLKCCKLNVEGCGPCEFIILSATSEKSREYFCKTDTPENRQSWGGVIQSVINKLIAGRQTFHGTPSFAPIQPRTSAPEASSSSSGNTSSPAFPSAGTSATTPLATSSSGASGPANSGLMVQSSDSLQRPSLDSASSSSSPALNRASMMFGAAGPITRFNPLGASEIVRVFLPDNSSKTVLFDTTQTVGALAQQVAKKLGPGYDLYCLYSCISAEMSLLDPESRLIDMVTNWPSKNDPEHFRLVFQPREESERQRASTIGFLNVQTNANAQSNLPKSSSFVSQVMGVIRKKPEWTGNILMSALPTPHLHRGLLSKKSGSQLGKDTEILAIVTEAALYYFDASATNPTDKSRGWMPLEKSGLFKERGPTSFVLHYTFPGTLDLHRQFDVSCKTEEEKAAWMAVLAPRCKGVVPAKKQATPRRNASGSSIPTPKKAQQVDVAAMLVATPAAGPKLTHPTAGRPKGAGKRPPSQRPKGAEISSSAGQMNPFGPSGIYASSSSPALGGSSPRAAQESPATSHTTSTNPYAPTNSSSPYGISSTATSTPMTIPNSAPPHVPALSNLPNGTPRSTDPSPRLYDGTPYTPNSMTGSPHLTSSPRVPYTGSSFGSIGVSDSSAWATPPLNLQGQTSSPRPGPTSSPRFVGASPASSSPSSYPYSSNPNLMSSSPGLLPTGGPVGFGPAPGTPPVSNSLLSQALASQPPPAVISPRGLNGSNGSLSSSNGSLSGSNPMILPTPSSSPAIVSVSPSYPKLPGTFAVSTPALTGPNPNLIPTSGPPAQTRIVGPAGYSFTTTASSLGNPALNPALSPYSTSSAPYTGPESDVIDMKSILGLSSPAIPKQSPFPAYQSPHITTPPPMTGSISGTIYSPVLAKPMPVPQSNPSAATPKHSPSPFHTAPSTTVSIQPLPSDATNTTSAVRTVEAPAPEIIMNLLLAPLDSSPFDDLPFD